METISLIGSGNVATHIGHALAKAGYRINGVFSRTLAAAQALAGTLHCDATDHLEALPEADCSEHLPDLCPAGASAPAPEQARAPEKPSPRPADDPAPAMTEEEAYLLSFLREQPLLQDDLLYAAQDGGREWTSAGVSATLMILEVKKLVRRLSDGRYEAVS